MATFQTITTDKKQYLPLLLLADPCEAMIDRYLEAGDMHVLSIGDAPVCVAVVIPYSDTACELKNLATDPQFQKQGYATRLMETLFKFFLDICQCLCFRHICGNTQTLIFCQRSVIRLLRIRLQDQIHAGYGESAVLLAGCT